EILGAHLDRGADIDPRLAAVDSLLPITRIVGGGWKRLLAGTFPCQFRFSDRAAPGAVDSRQFTNPRKGTNLMFEIMIGLAVLSAVGYYSYLSGKRFGSRKGFGAGRYGKK